MQAAKSAAVILGFTLLLCGCGQKPAEGEKVSLLKVGTVDVMRVMEEKPETVQIRLDWASQAGNTYMQLSDVKGKAEYEALQAQIEANSVAWQKKMDAFMEKSIDEVEVEASAIAKERGIDLVLVSNPLTKTLRYSNGEDLTTDVLLRLQHGGK